MLTPHATGLQMNNTLSSKLIAILLCLPMLTACSLTEERKSEDNLKSGDTIILKKDLTTPRGEYHIKFQHGEIKQKIKHFSNNCIIETRYKGPVTFTAGPYTVTQVYYGEEFFSDGGATIEYATTFNLETQAGSGNDKKTRDSNYAVKSWMERWRIITSRYPISNKSWAISWTLMHQHPHQHRNNRLISLPATLTPLHHRKSWRHPSSPD